MPSPLSLPPFDIKTRTAGNQQQVFDPIRRRYVALTPEEWVRQHFINYLAQVKGFPGGLMAVEHPVKVSGMQQRADIVAFGRNGAPILVVECKASDVPITRGVFEQAAGYNLTLRAPYLVVTNGVNHFCSRVDLQSGAFEMLRELPGYGEL